MNLIKSALADIVAAQSQSILPPADFYRALCRLARNDALLATALVPSSWTVGTPRGVPGALDARPQLETLTEAAPAAQADRGTPSAPENSQCHQQRALRNSLGP